jgi:hypothetical protein
MACFTKSENQKKVQDLAEAAGFKRGREQDAEEVVRVHYEHIGGYGLYVWEYEDGDWDLDHGYAAKDKLPLLQGIMTQLTAMRSKLRAEAKKLIIFDSKD